MTNSLFQLTFYLAAPFWALMIFAPNWRWTRTIIGSPWIIVPPLAVYLVHVLPEFPQLWSAMVRPDLTVLRDLLGQAWGAAAIWAQVVAWDLFIGRWMYRDAQRRHVPHLALAPILVLTILLSPFGFLIYLGVRATRRDRNVQDEPARPSLASAA